jgi:8-oxo-dGTP diphosphatase
MVDSSWRAPDLLSGSSILRSDNVQWNGGHPAAKQSGTCYCSSSSSNDQYCMCTPSLAIDLVIASGPDHIWLVRRKDTSQYATMGGFVNVGETVEHAVQRELKEEMGIVLRRGSPILFGVYSDPRRDNRRHTVSAVYAIRLDGTEIPSATDDIKEVRRIPMDDIDNYEFFADHKAILLDYRRLVRNEPAAASAAFEFDGSGEIVRSVCSTAALMA